MGNSNITEMGLMQMEKIIKRYDQAKTPFINNGIGYVKTSTVIDKNIFPEKGKPYFTPESRLILINKGEIHVTINLKPLIFQPNSLIIVPAKSVFQVNYYTKDADITILTFKNEILELINESVTKRMLIPGTHSHIMKISDSDFTLMKEMFELTSKIAQQEPIRTESIKYLISSILHNIAFLKDSTPEAKPLSRNEKIYNNFIEDLNKYGRKEHNVNFYANCQYLSQRHFSKVIKAFSGKNPIEWINQCTITEAKIMLKYTDMKIYEIADSLNISNESFFCKLFKKHTGKSPNENRKE